MECKNCGTTENVNFEGMCKECYEESIGINNKEYIEHENKKNIHKNLLIVLMVIIILISFGIYLCFKDTMLIDNYKEQVISILNEYKQGKIVKSEVKDKMDILSKKVELEYKDISTTESLLLTGILQRIEWDFTKGELSDTEVNKYIQEIKKIK